MVFYTEDNDVLRYGTNNRIGGETCGFIYKLSDDECFKKFKSKSMRVDEKALVLIQELNLENFCKIKKLLYDKNRIIIGYLMEYYQKEDIDILTMPIDYTIDNLCKLYNSVIKLSENNIFVNDMHTGNIIINSSGITIIDYDLYVLDGYFTGPFLEYKNISSLRYLFREIFLEALLEYHTEYNSDFNRQLIGNTFQLWNPMLLEKTCKKLTRHKYPIDYIKKEGSLQ